MPSVRIAYCRAAPDAVASDLVADPDRATLFRALADAGVSPAGVAWDDPDVDWTAPSLTVIRGTWDSDIRPAEYLAWARRVPRLLNPAPVLDWSLDKRYLLDLAADGVPVVPTQFVDAGSQWEPPPGEFVVKPAISAGARETARYAAGADASAHIATIAASGRAAMVQPYVDSVDHVGELSVVFIDGQFSHAARKSAVLDAGAGVVDALYMRQTVTPATASTTDVDAARHVFARVQARFDEPLLYARIDLFSAADGTLLLSEAELIDPWLFLDRTPGAADRFAAAVARRI